MFQANHFLAACGFECFSCCPSACVNSSLTQVAFILKIIFYFWRSICLYVFCWMAAFNYLLLPYTAAVCSQLMNPLRSPFLPCPAHTGGTSCCFAVMTAWRSVRGSAEDPCLCPLPLMGFSYLLLWSTCQYSSTAFFRQRCILLMTGRMELSYARRGISPDIFHCKNWNLPMLSEVASCNMLISDLFVYVFGQMQNYI